MVHKGHKDCFLPSSIFSYHFGPMCLFLTLLIASLYYHFPLMVSPFSLSVTDRKRRYNIYNHSSKMGSDAFLNVNQ